MNDKTFREIMDEIVSILTRTRMSERTATNLAVLLTMLETRYEQDTRKEGPG